MKRTTMYRLAVMLGALAYTLVLHYAYTRVIVSEYGYMGYVYNSSSPWYLFAGWTTAIIPSLWLSVSIKRASQLVYWTLYMLVIVPGSTIPWYIAQASASTLLFTNVLLVCCFLLLYQVYRVPLIELRSGLTRRAFRVLIVVVAVVLYAVVIRVFGLSFHPLSLAEAYGQRDLYKDAVSVGGRWVSYMVEWLSNAVNPLLIAYGLVSRRRVTFALGVLGQVFVYTITGFKSVLLSLVMVGIILVIIRRRGHAAGPKMVWGGVALVLVSVLLDRWLHFKWLTSLAVRRLLVTPGMLTGFYVDFFSSHAKALLGHGLFSSIVHYPYDLPPPNLIGYVYFGSAKTDANANLWADAYANFGIVGALVFTMVLGLVLWLADSITAKVDHRVAALMLGIPAFTLSNSALLTSLLTHGIAFSLVLLYFLPAEARVRETSRAARHGAAYSEVSGA